MEFKVTQVSATEASGHGWKGRVAVRLQGLVFVHLCTHRHRVFAAAEDCARKTAKTLT